MHQQLQQQFPIGRVTLASRRVQGLTKLPGGLRMDRIDLDTFIFQKHPDDCPVFLLDGNAYSATIQSAHQVTEPNVQRFWRLLQAPSLPLSGVGPLQRPNVLLVSPIEPNPGCVALVAIRVLFLLHLVFAPRLLLPSRLRISKGLIDVVLWSSDSF